MTYKINDHDKLTCPLCADPPPFLPVECAADLMGMTPNAICNNPKRHFKLFCTEKIFLLRTQVKMHIEIVLANGECYGECNSVFENKDRIQKIPTKGLEHKGKFLWTKNR